MKYVWSSISCFSERELPLEVLDVKYSTPMKIQCRKQSTGHVSLLNIKNWYKLKKKRYKPTTIVKFVGTFLYHNLIENSNL